MMFLIVFASVFVSVLAGGQEVAVTQDTLGNYNLKYLIDGISRVEHGDIHGNVNGGFSYIDPYGILRKTEFTSGIHGYNAIGTDIPVPVQDTPEVAHAKAKHLAALHAAYLVPRIPEFQGPEEDLITQVPFGNSFVAPANSEVLNLLLEKAGHSDLADLNAVEDVTFPVNSEEQMEEIYQKLKYEKVFQKAVKRVQAQIPTCTERDIELLTAKWLAKDTDRTERKSGGL
ncbi:hypothetical protein RN001_002544 [Aquatica leii]|uniref:Uncharacterized protein n=1 Tax=Aquatica leii TaxID=1421715 RepID=A0AAN7SR98_9COLE|nr:hypothetical protein RN001_002544 [Aquatica leii]